MMTEKMRESLFDKIVEANKTIKTTNIKGKQYAQVNQRIRAFRQVFPDGFIRTSIIHMEDGMVVMKTEVGLDDEVLATGMAYEREESSMINRTSYIENCETSCIGRALGMLGFGIDMAVASAEEMENAISQQDDGTPAGEAKIAALRAVFKKNGADLDKWLESKGRTVGDVTAMEAARWLHKGREMGGKA